jgi:hypothetical protein
MASWEATLHKRSVMWLLFSLLMMGALAQACHPECRYTCDDPVCPAACKPVCAAPVCSRCLNSTDTGLVCVSTGRCVVQCPLDMCEADACPQCETICPGTLCDDTPDCLVLCEETACAWRCEKPTNCPYPRCELACEAPACELSGAATLRGGVLSMTMLVGVLLTIL